MNRIEFINYGFTAGWVERDKQDSHWIMILEYGRQGPNRITHYTVTSHSIPSIDWPLPLNWEGS